MARELEQHVCIYLEHIYRVYRVSDGDSFTSAVYKSCNSVAWSTESAITLYVYVCICIWYFYHGISFFLFSLFSAHSCE